MIEGGTGWGLEQLGLINSRNGVVISLAGAFIFVEGGLGLARARSQGWNEYAHYLIDDTGHDMTARRFIYEYFGRNFSDVMGYGLSFLGFGFGFGIGAGSTHWLSNYLFGSAYASRNLTFRIGLELLDPVISRFTSALIGRSPDDLPLVNYGAGEHHRIYYDEQNGFFVWNYVEGRRRVIDNLGELIEAARSPEAPAMIFLARATTRQRSRSFNDVQTTILRRSSMSIRTNPEHDHRNDDHEIDEHEDSHSDRDMELQ
jgi:hypothetical protein